jgi:uncharacterized protein
MAGTNDPEWLRPHRRALEAGTLAIQRCTDCGYLRWPPARFCPTCLSEAANWTDVSGRGRLWSYAVSERANERKEGPYVLAAVTLDEGPFLLGRLTGQPEDLRIGDTVQAHISNLGDRRVIRFTQLHDPTP